MELISPGLGLVFWMTISFVMVLLILRKYAWHPILSNIRLRERIIAKSLINARRVEEELAKLDQLKAEKAAEAEKLHREMLQHVSLEAEGILGEARDKANELRQKILEDASKAIEIQKKAALVEIRNQVADLSLEMAEKVLEEEFSDKEKSTRYINQLLDRVMLN